MEELQDNTLSFIKVGKLNMAHMCWEKSIEEKSINGLLMHAERAHYGVCRKKCFISYMRISHLNSSVSIDTYV